MGWKGRNNKTTDVRTRAADIQPAGHGRRFQALYPPHRLLPGALAGVQNRYAVDSGCPTTETTLPSTWLTLTRNLPAYVHSHGMTHAQHWFSWPTDTEQTLNLRTTSLRAHANKLRGMQQPREGHGPVYNIF